MVRDLGPGDALPGARETLSELARRGVRTAVASGSRNARHILERLGLMQMLDALVSGDEITRSKPHPEVFQKTAERLGVPPQSCLVVEDAPSGVEAALRAGMKALGVSRGRPLTGAVRTVGSLAEITAEEMLAL